MKIYVNLLDKYCDIDSQEVNNYAEAIKWYEDRLKGIPEKDVEETSCIVDIVDDNDVSVSVTIQELMDAILE